MFAEHIESNIDAGGADVLTVDFDRSDRRHDQLFGETVDISVGESQAVFGIIVPRAYGRIDLAGEVARVVPEQIFILQTDSHVENILIGGGQRKQVSIFHLIDIAQIAEEICGIFRRNRL